MEDDFLLVLKSPDKLWDMNIKGGAGDPLRSDNVAADMVYVDDNTA